MSRHKKYGRRARVLYRVLILISVSALILAILALYFLGELDGEIEF